MSCYSTGPVLVNALGSRPVVSVPLTRSSIVAKRPVELSNVHRRDEQSDVPSLIP